MHANLSVTDGVYGILSENDVRVQIARLVPKSNLRETNEIERLISLNKHLLKKLRAKSP